MRDRIELRKIYEMVKLNFPGCEHDEEVYKLAC